MLDRNVPGLLRTLCLIAGLATAQAAWSALPTGQQAGSPGATLEQPELPAGTAQALQMPAVDSAVRQDARQVECVAKVILHEAGNQPRQGRVAVAQVIRNRVKAGFGADACAVIRQRGQFFDVDAYHPARSNPGWSEAVAIASDMLDGHGAEVAPGALFFHAVYASVPAGRRVATIGDHVFYR